MQLAEVQADGATLRDHLLAAASQGSSPHPLLSQAPPRGAETIWDALVSLAAQRPDHVATPASEIEAWQRLHGVRLTAWEVDALQAADRACVAVMRAQAARRRK